MSTSAWHIARAQDMLFEWKSEWMNVLSDVGLESLLWPVDLDTRYKIKAKHYTDGFTHSEFSKQKNEQYISYITYITYNWYNNITYNCIWQFSFTYLLDLPGFCSALSIHIHVIPCKKKMETLGAGYSGAESVGHFLYWSQGWDFPCLNTW